MRYLKLQEKSAADRMVTMDRLDKYKPLLIIIVLFLINLFLFNNKMINLHTDFGREILFSKMVSQGAVLYRDIFNTFVCPFSYLFNGLVLKFAPLNISTFYISGAVNAALILGCVYLISRKFLNNTFSCVLTVFVMYYCCFYSGLMNFLTPYSYGIVYGLSACLVSVLFFINYLKSDKKKFLYLSFFFGGLSAVCKYEFVVFAVLLFVFTFVKKQDVRTWILALLSFLSMPLLCITLLFQQGLEFNDVKNYISLLKNFINQPYLEKVYALTCHFSLTSLTMALKTFCVACMLFFVMYFFKSKSIKFAAGAVWTFLFLGIWVYFPLTEYFTYSFFGFINYLIMILVVIKFKELKKDLPVLFLTAASLIVSLKSFWFLSSNFYGRYFLPLLIITLAVLLQKYYFNNEKFSYIFEKVFCAILIFLSFTAFRLNLVSIVLKNNVLKTPYGSPAVTQGEYAVLSPLLDYINGNTKQSDRIVILGQAPIVNFLTNRDSLPLFSHFDEAIAGAYGSERIVKAFGNEKPEFIVVFEGYDKTSSYCNTYGKAVCEWGFNHYETVKTINPSKGNDTAYILRLKERNRKWNT